MPNCDDPVTDTGRKNSVPWCDPAQACPVGIPDNTASVSFVNGQPVFSLGVGVGTVPGGGDNCPPVPPAPVSFVTGAENIGSGEGLFGQLVSGVLQFLSLQFGSGFTVTNQGTSLLIELIDSGVISWDDILSKPAEFPPSAHTHTLADITDAGSAAGADSTDFDPAGAASAAQAAAVAAANAYTDLLASTLGAMAFEADGPNDGQEYVRKNNAWAVASVGSADFTGPAGATSGNFVSFADNTGKVGADSGSSAATFATAAQGALAATAIQPQLTENNPILFDAALSADGQYSGFCIAGTAGATLAFGDLCYLAAADSRWELADADAEATAGGVMLGMCVLAAASDGDPTRMLLLGNIRADAAFPALTVSAPAYVGTTPGDIQVAQPNGEDDVIRICGHALTADVLFFRPSNDWMTYAA